MLSRLKQFITTNNLFSQKDKILLTVSGGIDSVVLCDLFHQAKITFGIAHCNFGLRGDESDGDELYVKQLAKKYSVPLFVNNFDTRHYAAHEKISIQMAARELRYKWFEEIRKKNKYSFVATAHHKGDSAETLLINLVRGTGIHGLHGILPKQQKLIRPLLFASREDIMAYANEKKLSWREDSSNTSDKYLRNNIRLNIIPQLKKINPSLEDSLFETSRRLHHAEQAIQLLLENKRKDVLKKQESKISIDIKKLKALKPTPFFLFELIKNYGFNEDTVTNIIASLNKISGKVFFSSTHQLIKDRNTLVLTKKNVAQDKKQNKKYTFTKSVKKINAPILIHFKKMKLTGDFVIPKEKHIACFDYSKLSATLSIRKWQHGDTFMPLGMKGEKKISDFFTDNKFSLYDKENTWLLLSGNKIVWIIGHRTDERYKITPNTRNILICSLIN